MCASGVGSWVSILSGIVGQSWPRQFGKQGVCGWGVDPVAWVRGGLAHAQDHALEQQDWTGAGGAHYCNIPPTCRLVLGWGGWEPGRGIILVSRVGDSRPYSLEDCPC